MLTFVNEAGFVVLCDECGLTVAEGASWLDDYTLCSTCLSRLETPDVSFGNQNGKPQASKGIPPHAIPAD